MSELISVDFIDNIIKANKHLVGHRSESFGVNKEKLVDVVNTVNITNSPVKRKNIVKKSISSLSWNSLQSTFQ